MSRLRILLLCDDNPNHANTILDHIAAFVKFSRNEVRIFNPVGIKSSTLLDFEDFDVVIIHYSICILYDYFLGPEFKKRLRRYNGLKIQFIQDDYRWVNAITAVMREIGIHVLFTLVPAGEITKIWDNERLPGVVKLTTLAGYVPNRLVKVPSPPLEIRPIDIGYRGRILPYWLGKLSQEKVQIAQGVLERVEQYGLRYDIAWREEDRIYGTKWDEFLASCKATLGTESGATITDFDGSIENAVIKYLEERPGAMFADVYRDVLFAFEGNVRMNIVSPRIFEAIAFRTALVLFPGEYSGVLRPWEHYIPLNKDYSNFHEVVDKLRDMNYLKALTGRAYDHVIASGLYSYRILIQELDETIAAYHNKLNRRTWAGVCVNRCRNAFDTVACKGKTALKVGRDVCNGEARLWQGFVEFPSRQTILKAFLAGALMLRNASLRRLVWEYFAAKVRRDVGVRKLLDESLKLALLGYVQAEALPEAPLFQVIARWDVDAGRVLLRSVPGRSGSGVTDAVNLEPAAVGAVVRRGEWRSLEWDHTAMGGYLPYALTGRTWLSVRYGEVGWYRFTALEAIGRRSPAVVAAVLEAMFAGRIKPRLCWSRLEASRAAVPVVERCKKILEKVRRSVGLSAIGLEMLLKNRSARYLLLRYLQDGKARGCIPLGKFVGDLDRTHCLGLLRKGKRLSCPSVEVHTEAGQDFLLFKSVRLDGTVRHYTRAFVYLRPNAQVRRICWDHSAIGPCLDWSVLFGRFVQISMGPNGVYEFPWLTRFAKEHSDEVARLLVWIQRDGP